MSQGNELATGRKRRKMMLVGRAIGAVVAQQLYTLWVGGSNPSSPTILSPYAEPTKFFKSARTVSYVVE
jgi:hypothetical protein